MLSHRAQGIIACSALYPEIECVVPAGMAIRYVSQSLHEFPVGVAREDDISRSLQGEIDNLDSPKRDRIVLVYANNGDGLVGLRTRHAPLIVSRADDCISMFLDRSQSRTMGELKSASTYYLSRELIDCGVDAYKLYTAYCSGADELQEWFMRAKSNHPDLRVTWFEDDRFVAAADRDQGQYQEIVGRFFHQALQYYERITLIDTGNLYSVHRRYTETFRAFVEQLSDEFGDGHAVELTIIDGDVSLLHRLLEGHPLGSY